MWTRSFALGWMIAAAGLVLGSCSNELDPADMEQAMQPKVRFYYNNSGTRVQNQFNPEVDDMLIQHIDRARVSVDCAVMGFSRPEVIAALVRAHYRGVRVRLVGDARHLETYTEAYEVFDDIGIPVVVGNQYSIMHNKFFIVDDRFVVTGTGNITPTDYDRNNNNYILFDSPEIARDFYDEFVQLFSGRFGAAKLPINNGNDYQVGDTRVEVYFSPQEDAMGKILEHLSQAEHSIYFMIFAFTKDQVGSWFINKHLEFSLYNRCCDPAEADKLDDDDEELCQMQVVCDEPFTRKEVVGVVDRSQLHSNGPYHEVYRLLSFGVPLRLDGNDNSQLPGDYQAGGGRLHSKTVVIDTGFPTAKVVTGSFNWSSSATQANDEVLMVLHGDRGAQLTRDYWQTLWERGKAFGEDFAGPGGTVEPGDVVFSELHWDGWNGENDPSDAGGDDVSNDEFIELLNTTNRPIDLSMWTIGDKDDFHVGLYPGTIIGPHERFLIVDHNLQAYEELVPQDIPSAFQDADFVMNGANDARFLRLNLHNVRFGLRLMDPRGNIIDVAGNGGPPFAGGRREEGGQIKNYSMERVFPLKDGDEPSAWQDCRADEGGRHVVPRFRDRIIATPGEENSAKDFSEPEPDEFRAPEE